MFFTSSCRGVFGQLALKHAFGNGVMVPPEIQTTKQGFCRTRSSSLGKKNGIIRIRGKHRHPKQAQGQY